MAKSFGLTWWGEQWLHSLTHIDYANRIPRGASYARKGAVKEIIIKDSTVKAKVQGSRPHPYSVTITVPPFSESDKQKLMNKILTHPSIISHLLNRNLSPVLLDITQELHLPIFPRSWNDLEMKCSCPDWAVPCKHLAAAIYKIGQEIDNNPFIVFELHGVNLLDELKKRGITLDTQEMMQPVPLDNLITERKGKRNNTPEETTFNPDYTQLEDIGDTLVAVLPSSPAFYSRGDFRSLYAKQLAQCTKLARKLLTGKTEQIPPPSSTLPILPSTDIRVCFNKSLQATCLFHDGSNDERKVSLDEFIPTLLHLNPEMLPDYQPSVELLYKALHFSLQILAKGAVIPQIVTMPQSKYIVRWLPAVINEQVARWMLELESALPAEVLLYNDGTSKFLQDDATWLISLFLNHLIRTREAISRRTAWGICFFMENKSRSTVGVNTTFPVVSKPGRIAIFSARNATDPCS